VLLEMLAIFGLAPTASGTDQFANRFTGTLRGRDEQGAAPVQPDTLAVIAVLAVLLVAAVILGFLLHARRSAGIREEAEAIAKRDRDKRRAAGNAPRR
jgi:hypothetical protein